MARNYRTWTKATSALGHAAKARKRLMTAREPELMKLDDREFLGVLQWHDASGRVRRWTIRQGPRANNIRIIAARKEIIAGWDRLCSSLRKHLSTPKKTLRP